jgi:hypothetical protein
LVCAPDVITGHWRVGQVVTADESGWGPITRWPLDLGVSACAPLDLAAVTTTSLDLDPLVCEEV